MGKNLTDYPEVLTDRDVASLFGVHFRTVQAMARNQEIHGRQIGNKWRFHRSAIENFLLVKGK